MAGTSDDALSYIHSVTWRGSRLGLSRTFELMARLGDPQKELKFIHVAGTNGKGSTAAMLAAILSAGGYRTGLYTSPYIRSFHERMQVNGVPITDEELERITDRVRTAASGMDDPPTEFELVTAIGFCFFQEKDCDIVVLEVGMGGRLDSTNVIGPPEAAVITAIGLDHTAELGDTVEKIAAEKAGIVKDGCDVVLYEQGENICQVVADACARHGARLHRVHASDLSPLSADLSGQRFRYRGADYSLALLGAHQLRNAATVLTCVEALRQKGWDIPDEAVRRGLSEVRWPARFQVVSRHPLTIVDGGHNPHGVQTVAENLSLYCPGRKVVFLTGVLADKEYTAMMKLVAPLAKCFVTVTPENPRALDAASLAAVIRTLGVEAVAASSLPEGLAMSRARCGADDVLCIFGSLYMVGAMLPYLENKT